MSRITIALSPPYASCVVGYDPPLGTFFAQVYQRRGARGPSALVRWIGADLQELPTLDALVSVLADVVMIPPAIQQQLLHDQQATGFRPNLGTRMLQQLRTHREEEAA
jgi:hypothetical protein